MKEHHFVSISPSVKFGYPCVDNNRITVEMVAQIWWEGSQTLEGIKKSWPDLNRGVVLVACWYMARYGTRLWRKRWKDWLKIADIELWNMRYKTCLMPPQKEV